MAKVLALGGCGGVGRYAVPTLLRDAKVTEIVLADLDGERAAAQARDYGKRVRPLRLDVTDGAALRAAITDADVVMSTVGPFFRFGAPILRAVLEVGRSYVDVCDDPEPTLEMLALDGLAKERGVTGLVGLGITPGVSNLLAAIAVRELDRATSVITGWSVDAALPDRIGKEPSAATLHGVEQLTGRIRVHRGGQSVLERPIAAVEVDYPGLGPRTAWTIGHPEPATLPRTFPELQECLNVMVTRPGNAWSMRALRLLVDAGIVSKRRAAWLAERAEGVGGRTPTLAEWSRAGGAKLGLPTIFALARGEREGAPQSVGVMLASAPAGGIGGTTGVPLALGVSSLLAGEVAGPGVRSPEEGLDPARFLARLAPLCDPPCEDVEALLIVSRSWEPRSLASDVAARSGEV